MGSFKDLNKKQLEEFEKSKKFLSNLKKKYDISDAAIEIALEFLSKNGHVLIFNDLPTACCFALYISMNRSGIPETKILDIMEAEQISKEPLKRIIRTAYDRKIDDVLKVMHEIHRIYDVEFDVIKLMERLVNLRKYIVIAYPPRYAAVYAYVIVAESLSIKREFTLKIIESEKLELEALTREISAILASFNVRIEQFEDIQNIFDSGVFCEII